VALHAAFLFRPPAPQDHYHLQYRIVQEFLLAGPEMRVKTFKVLTTNGCRVWKLFVSQDFLVDHRIMLLHAFLETHRDVVGLPSKAAQVEVRRVTPNCGS